MYISLARSRVKTWENDGSDGFIASFIANESRYTYSCSVCARTLIDVCPNVNESRLSAADEGLRSARLF